MKITLLQENLYKGLQAVSRLTSTGGNLPILSHVLLRAKKGGVYIKATNMEQSVQLKVGAKVEKEGEVAIPAKTFNEFVGSLPAGKVMIEVKGEEIKLSSGATKAKLQGTGAADFPEMNTKVDKVLFKYKGDWEKEIGKIVFSASTEESRPALTGVQVSRVGKKLRMVTTDGYRLSIMFLKADFGKGKEEKWTELIPAKAVAEFGFFKKSFDGDEEVEVGIAEGGNQLVFRSGEMVMVTRLIEGEFPPFEDTIPKEVETKVVFGYEELLSSVRRAAIFARESANIIRWEVGESNVVISANSPQVGENETVVEAEVKGEGGKVAFNSRYLMDFFTAVDLSKTEKKEIEFEMSGGLSPGQFKIKGEEGFSHIIMPVRIQDK